MGILKSIGMTNKQLEQSFMLEGLFTTLLAIILTCIIGIPGGYIIGIVLKNAGMSMGFVFPAVAFSLYIVVMLIFGCMLTIFLIHSWKKQSVIEVIRN